MDTTKTRPATDFARIIKLRDRLESVGMMTDEERISFQRILMFYGRHAIKSLE